MSAFHLLPLAAKASALAFAALVVLIAALPLLSLGAGIVA
jgi:hypothetical protein